MHLSVHDKSVSAVLLADSGSTKTDWCLVVDGSPVFQCQTQGLNPALQPVAQVKKVLMDEFLVEYQNYSSQPFSSLADSVAVRFYGAGCKGNGAVVMREALADSFGVPVERISVESDLMAAAHALCGANEGIVSILGTGSNSCLYDGEKIVSNVSPLGYILGDEGSGAVLGKHFINALFKGRLPESIMWDFADSTGLDADSIIRHVYREPMANRFLASLSPFIYSHIGCAQIENIVISNFIDFFKNNILYYRRPDLRVNALGGVAYYFKPQLQTAAVECGCQLGEILRSPMPGLVAACKG